MLNSSVFLYCVAFMWQRVKHSLTTSSLRTLDKCVWIYAVTLLRQTEAFPVICVPRPRPSQVGQNTVLTTTLICRWHCQMNVMFRFEISVDMMQRLPQYQWPVLSKLHSHTGISRSRRQECYHNMICKAHMNHINITDMIYFHLPCFT